MAEILETPEALTFRLPDYDPDYPVFGFEARSSTAREDVPELEALHRLAMVLHNQYPWDRRKTRLTAVGELDDDDFVVVFHPRTAEVLEFIRRVKQARPPRRTPAGRRRRRRRKPVAPYPPVEVRERFAGDAAPRGAGGREGRARVHQRGPHPQRGLQLVADERRRDRPKTGIEERRYTERDLDQMSLEAAEARWRGPGARPEEIGAVLFCSCTSTTLIPSVATWLSGQLGIFQTHASFDLVAACAGFPYGLARRRACSRRSSGPCWWCAPRSSPTRSAASGRRG